jgi:hypothetical protein
VAAAFLFLQSHANFLIVTNQIQPISMLMSFTDSAPVWHPSCAPSRSCPWTPLPAWQPSAISSSLAVATAAYGAASLPPSPFFPHANCVEISIQHEPSVVSFGCRWWRSHGRLECHAFMHDYRGCCSTSSADQDIDTLSKLPPIPLIDQTHQLHGLFLLRGEGQSGEPFTSVAGEISSLSDGFEVWPFVRIRHDNARPSHSFFLH